MRKVLFTLAVFMICIANVLAQVWVEGKCYLNDETDNSVTLVIFNTASPTAVTDSTYTNIQGSYQINLSQGIYNISYSHEGYYTPYPVIGVNCYQPQELDEVTLIRKIGIDLSGSISGTLIDTLYTVVGDISVNSGDSLIIEAGAIFLFEGNYKLFVDNSYIKSVGTMTDTIKFLPSPRISYWQGIFLSNVLENSRFEYCYVTDDTIGFGIWGSNDVLIRNCLITNGFKGIENSSSNAHISKCTLKNNVYGITTSGNIIKECDIVDNDVGVSLGGNATIINCFISRNIEAGIETCGEGNNTIRNCTITKNLGTGVRLGPSPGGLINSIIEVNTNGVLFENENSSVSFCDFYNNSTNFSGNNIPAFLGEKITINSNGDSCDAYMNILNDPLFIDSYNNDFHLQAGSPCINAGDPNSPLDPDGTIADMGAFYFHTGPKPAISVSSQHIYFDNTVLDSSSIMPLTISNIGTEDLILYSVSVSDSLFQTDWNPEDTLITPGSSIEINVIFTPVHFDINEGTITIYNNDHIAHIGLSGMCVPKGVNYATSLILAGGGAEASNWDYFINNTVPSTNDAYSKLAYGRYYTNTRMFYMNPISWQDLNGDGIDDEIVDTDIITPQSIKDAIMSLVDEPDEFYPNVISFSGHGHVGEFDINGNAEDNISSDSLAVWLDYASLDQLSPLVLVIEACFSGSFIPVLAKENRIIISACRDDQFADYLNSECFSTNFWEEIWYGNNVWDAFQFAYERAQVYLNGQEALLDADGNGIPNEATDQEIAQNIYLGGQIMHGTLLPEIKHYPEEVEMVSGQVEVNVSCNGVMDKVWFRIYPKNYTGSPPLNDLPFVEMIHSGDFNYIGSYNNNGFIQADIEYIIRVEALDDVYNYAIPRTIPLKIQSLNVEYEERLPKKFCLLQNYPNPFNPTTTISYQLPKSSFVRLTIYDINGRLVDTLVNEQKNVGSYTIKWNANNVSSGIYLYRIDAGGFSSVKKCLVVK